MKSLSDLWDLIEPVVQSEGLELYDIERSSEKRGGVIRVYLSGGGREAGAPQTNGAAKNSTKNFTKSATKSEGGVNLDDCARISRMISSMDRFEELIPEKTVLEVSSPGINRKLRSEKHFASAVGEHVSIKAYFEDEGKERTVKGNIVKFEESTVFLKEDGTDAELPLLFRDVVTARVDYQF